VDWYVDKFHKVSDRYFVLSKKAFRPRRPYHRTYTVLVSFLRKYTCGITWSARGMLSWTHQRRDGPLFDPFATIDRDQDLLSRCV